MRQIEDILRHERVEPVDVGFDGAMFIFRRSNRKGRHWKLLVIASVGGGWDHVSVSTHGKDTPSWADMEAVKRLCFRPDEVAMQLHVAEDDHINIRANCLHLWRPQTIAVPLPPKVFV